MLQSRACYQLTDDLVNGLEERWGRPCWHTKQGVQLNVTNDTGLLENLVYQLLRLQFSGSPCYVDLIDMFRRNVYHSVLGKTCDARSLRDAHAGIHTFTPQKYATHVRLKTTEGVYMPVAVALLAVSDMILVVNPSNPFHRVQVF